MLTGFKQERPDSCVAACVRMVLSGFGQFPTERRIRKMLGNPVSGLTLEQASQQLLKHNADAVFHDAVLGWLDLRDCLRAGLHPIVGIERGVFGHAYALHAVVIVAVGVDTIQVLDPLAGLTPETFLLATFEFAWNLAGQQALVIKAPISLL